MTISPGYLVEGRAHLLGRVKVIFDLLLLVGLAATAAPRQFWPIPVLDLLLVLVYLRYVRQLPALLTFLALMSWALLLAMAPAALRVYGVGVWALFPLIPAWAAFVLTRRLLVRQIALATAAVMAVGLAFWARTELVVSFTPLAVLVAGLITLAGIVMLTWVLLRLLRPDSGARDLLGTPVTVVRGIVIVPFNWVVGGVQVDTLHNELEELQQQHNARWMVLDLAPGGNIGRHDLVTIEQAANSFSNGQCTVVIARPPVDAVGHLDVAQPAVGRIERFATVAQATEAGLRRLGWTQQADQARRLITTY